jgi:hypothetical protein
MEGFREFENWTIARLFSGPVQSHEQEMATTSAFFGEDTHSTDKFEASEVQKISCIPVADEAKLRIRNSKLEFMNSPF